MAERHEQVTRASSSPYGTPPVVAGTLAAGAIATVMAGALVALALTTTGNAGPPLAALADPYLWRVVRFTLWQATLSTFLSVGLAIPLARALARRQSFPGRAVLIRLLGLPLALPALVVVLGIIAVLGNQGWLNQALRLAGAEPGFNLYGLTGILVAHVFFNLPLATRLLLARLERIPGESWRLAAQLGLPTRQVFWLIEWPEIRKNLPAIAGLVFMLCIASFTIVLTLGGGPAATTIEVAIYQSLRFDFDPPRAVTLALLQITICGLFALFGRKLATDVASLPGIGRRVSRPDGSSRAGRLIDGAVIMAAATALVLPLLALIVAGLAAPLAKLASEPLVWTAVTTSLVLSATSAAICLLLALSLLAAIRSINQHPAASPKVRNRFEAAALASASLILVMPPIVIGAGWFVLLRQVTDVFSLAPVLIIIINALMALPFALRILSPAVASAASDHNRLCASLGISGWHRLRLIDWPVLRRPVGMSLGFAMALSLGDLGVIALFGSEDLTTLPWLLYQRLGSYRVDDASGLALLLAVLCLGILYAADRLGEGRTNREASL